MHTSLLTAVLTVLAMTMSFAGAAVTSGTAHAAPVVGPGGGAAQPRLTANTKAPCNSKPKRHHVRCFAVVRTPANHEITPNAAGPPETALGPADIQDAYDLPTNQGDGRTVAIVDAGDDAKAESDLAVFRQEYGLPPCTTDNDCFTKVNQRGEQGNYPPDAGWGIEISLDLDAVSAACPLCHIMLVEADTATFDDMGAAVEEAVALGAKYVANSYGLNGSEIPGEADYDHYFNHKGVAITFSSGDSPHPNWPASNPHVTAVGGTRLTRDDSTDRGWTEVPWTSGGSGCSAYEPKPDYQSANGLDTNCDMRATADVSADADPASGLAVYDSHDGYNWVQVGGTSLSSPLIAGMYALAGTPVQGTYPVTYPYDPTVHDHLFDITTGSNGSCGNLLCEAGPGWDGPTGWGTPNGVAALRSGPHGHIAGQVTDAASGDPIAGAKVSGSGGYSVKTDTNGDYDLSLPVGSYDITGWAYGYADKPRTGVQVTEGDTTTVDVALHAVPNSTLSGTVTDASGHGWPLYARITIDDYPGKTVFTDPYTGHYSVDLSQQHTYTLHVTPVDTAGYETKDLAATIDTSDVQQAIAITIDPTMCTAPGYAYTYHGAHEQFTGWSGTTPQDGWSVVDNIGNGRTWLFDSKFQQAPPGGDPDFAGIDDLEYDVSSGIGPLDTSLVSPVADLSNQATPSVEFDTSLGLNAPYNSGSVDLSLDGGQTWAAIWNPTSDFSGHMVLPIPQAAGRSQVKVRFHYVVSSPPTSLGWSLDNVVIGGKSCDPTVAGGLVAGSVIDANTGDGIDGVEVATADAPSDSDVTRPTPDDAKLSDGFYELFVSGDGDHDITATRGGYVPSTATIDVAADTVTRQDLMLKAGHLTVSPGGVSAARRLGKAVTKTVTLTNDGTAPVHVELGEQSTGFTQTVGETTVAPTSARPDDALWSDVPPRPDGAIDAVTASHDGKVYSVAGATARSSGYFATADSYVYDPSAGQWNPIAPAPEGLREASGAFLGGRLYLVGGL